MFVWENTEYGVHVCSTFVAIDNQSQSEECENYIVTSLSKTLYCHSTAILECVVIAHCDFDLYFLVINEAECFVSL